MDYTVSALGEEKAEKPKARHGGEKGHNGRARNQT
jgi:hypothetical protein